jgi:glycine oxidase
VTSTWDVVVVGGGAIGAACARELALAGQQVLVVESGGELGQAWRAAGGMLAPQIEADGDDVLLDLGLKSRDMYASLTGALRDTTGIDIGLWQEGIARVAADSDEALVLQAKVAWQQAHGHPSEWLDATEIRRRWPWLGPMVGALWAPTDGALEPTRLVEALLTDARRLGATVINDRIRALDRSGQRITGVTGHIGHYSTAAVVIAAGAWSPLIEGLPRQLPVTPVRGQMAALRWPEGVHRAIIYQKDSYILARGPEAILGSTMEYVGFHPEVTASGLAGIFSSTITLSPSLARGKIRRSWAGLRPITPDGLPIIGAEPDLPGLWYATGHGRNGILLAALTGRVVAQMVGGEPSVEDLSRVSVTRFAPDLRVSPAPRL